MHLSFLSPLGEIVPFLCLTTFGFPLPHRKPDIQGHVSSFLDQFFLPPYCSRNLFTKDWRGFFFFLGYPYTNFLSGGSLPQFFAFFCCLCCFLNRPPFRRRFPPSILLQGRPPLPLVVSTAPRVVLRCRTLPLVPTSIIAYSALSY